MGNFITGDYNLLDLLGIQSKASKKANKALEALWQQSEVPGERIDFRPTPDSLAIDLGNEPSTYGENQAAVDRSRALRQYDPVQALRQYNKETGADPEFTKNMYAAKEAERQSGIMDNMMALVEGNADLFENGREKIARWAALLDPSASYNAKLGANNGNYATSYVNSDGRRMMVTRDGRQVELGEEDPNPRLVEAGGGFYTTGRGMQPTPFLTPQQTGQGMGEQQNTTADIARRYADRLKAFDDNSNVALSQIDAIMKDEDFGSAYGINSMIPDGLVPAGTARHGMIARIAQTEGQAFMQAFEALKGGGQITENETKQATLALARIGQRNISDEDAMEAWQEFRDAIERGQAKLRQRIETDFSADYGSTTPYGGITIKRNGG